MQVFKVGGMSCGHCVKAITKAVQGEDPAAKVEVDLAAGLVRVDSGLDAQRLLQAIRDEGYEAGVA
ncbi:heavy-metal-associated domain-containing protein [Pseudomonas sp. LRF_L74]|uniref:heavy-metal-associated domain-containing protein n=1 Tax=Pseudomonas sp. LRF_L74 TaxID=3369422 RepID=UPI003F6020F0